MPEQGAATAAKAKTQTKQPPRARVEMRKTELIPVASIVLSDLEPQQRRRAHFKPEEIAELSESIREHGLINPITVRPAKKSGSYELVAGERRLLATKKAGYKEIEAIIRDLTDQATIEIQLVENLKRLDLPPLDEALSYKYLIDHAEIEEKGAKRPYTVSDIAAKFARTEELILRRLKLVDLCDQGKTDLADGYLPLGHAELLARFSTATQEKLLKKDVYRYSYDSKDARAGGTNSLKTLLSTIEREQSSFILKRSKFDREDPSLHKEGLVCSTCPKRTGYSPKLFTDTKMGESDTCLDHNCWNGKLTAMLQAKREKIAAELPNPKNLPIKQIALDVPLVKKDSSESYYAHRNVSIGKGVYLENSWSKKTHSICKTKNACKLTEKALRVGGDGIGASTFICRSKSCSVHKVKEARRDVYDYEADRLKSQEHDLNEAIDDAVRILLITKKVEQYDEKKWVFDDEAGRLMLLESCLEVDVYDVLHAFEKIVPAELVKNRYQTKDVPAILAKQKTAVISRIFAVLCFGDLGSSDYRDRADQTPIRKLAEEFDENYDLLAAEARVKLTPTEGGHRAAAQAHLDAIKAGQKSTPPTVFWPRKNVEKPEKKQAKGKKAAASA